MAEANWTTDTFEYPTNYSNGTSVDGFGSLIQYVSFITAGWFAAGFTLLIWLATFFISLVSGSRKAMMVASFVTFPFCIYFVRLDMIHPMIPMIVIALGILGAIGSKESGGTL